MSTYNLINLYFKYCVQKMGETCDVVEPRLLLLWEELLRSPSPDEQLWVLPTDGVTALRIYFIRIYFTILYNRSHSCTKSYIVS